MELNAKTTQGMEAQEQPKEIKVKLSVSNLNEFSDLIKQATENLKKIQNFKLEVRINQDEFPSVEEVAQEISESVKKSINML